MASKSKAKVRTDGKGTYWNSKRNPYAGVKRGRSKDLGDTYYRSSWERNYARILNLLVADGIITSWEYEPQKFYFTEFGYKAGPWVFTPDFAVQTGEAVVFHEVKGRETGADRRKWARFRKHSGYEIKIIKQEQYDVLQATFASRIPTWEYSSYEKRRMDRAS